MKPITNMTYQEIVNAILKAKGIQVCRDATGMGWIAVDKNDTRIAGTNASRKLTIFSALTQEKK